MVLPEYGRNIQRMVDHLKTIENKADRNNAAKVIISIMGNMNPHLRDISDFKHKLWDHIYIMSDFDLDIDSPYPMPERQKLMEKPRKLEYPAQRIRFMHYGKTLEDMIQKAAEFDDGPEKELLTEVLANHMKKSYLTWNRDSVSDDNIFHNLKLLSNGKLQPKEDLKLIDARDVISSKPKKKKHSRANKNDSRGRSH